ncbi:hypothetical protein B0A49_00526 [Cryomyces minteri]|uniref:SET domain-containing protein n=1 Tax=Cryomyces minteri TaxID=331657 RepID=A0A4U0XV70_9PEZI|nr:hypothetical protein B0A49_00526 [Cryomyces minteri]
MTDSLSLATLAADRQQDTIAPFAGFVGHSNGVTALEVAADEDSIKCICGYPEDDGHTVFCEKCKTWQHVACYYGDGKVPDDHDCIDCDPRPVDAHGAKERQFQRRVTLTASARGVRRMTSTSGKSHKKKVRDPVQVPTQNGWPTEHAPSLLRGTEIQRDQPPPAKRPKTSHKSSGSVSSHTTPGHTGVVRNRIKSSNDARQSPTKSPTGSPANGYSNEDFSVEYMHLYRDPNFVTVTANCHNSLSVTGSLSAWLNSESALASETNKQWSEVFKLWDGTMEEHPAPKIQLQVNEDYNHTYHGLHPIWQWVTIDSEVVRGDVVGELKGQIGRKDEYIHDERNRWNILRHPEPFVFFHPELPIYIDSRSEGNLLRFVRRSCRPNTAMKIIITEGREYHFCLVATEEVLPGGQITVGWNLDAEVHRLLPTWASNGTIKKGLQELELEYLSSWATTVLANYGGCACGYAQDICAMERLANVRISSHLGSTNGHSLKSQKIRKPKKSGTLNSPLPTGHATNSRAGSESMNRNEREDDADSRSVSGSSRSKPASRDITPMTHVSADAFTATGHELSDREKRKIAQQEKLFEQLEQDEQQGHKKKKRNSGGSNLNTPSLATSVRPKERLDGFGKTTDPFAQKQLGHSAATIPPSLNASNPSVAYPGGFFDAGATQAPSAFMFSQQPGRRTTKEFVQPSKPSTKPATAIKKQVRPVYAEASTQTNPDPENDLSSIWPPKPTIRRPYLSLTQRLLQRCARNRVMREERLRASVEPSSSAQNDAEAHLLPTTFARPAACVAEPALADIDAARAPSLPPKAIETMPQGDNEDVEMKDAVDNTTISSPNSTTPRITPQQPAAASVSENLSQTSHPPLEPPPPPWPATDHDATQESVTAQPKDRRVQNMPMPPPPTNLFAQTSTTPFAAGPADTVTDSIVQSPLPLPYTGPTFSPSATSAVAPSPAKKKLSLSDYTNRAKARQTETSHGRTSSPGPGAGSGMPASLLQLSSSLTDEIGSQDLQGSAIADTPPVAEEQPSPSA